MNRKIYYSLLVLFAVSIYILPIFFADIFSERITGKTYHDINAANETNATTTTTTTTTTLRTVKIDISTPQKVALNLTSGVEFDINGLTNQLFLRYIGPNFVTFKVSSLFAGINLLDTKNIDITGDGRFDVSLTLDNLTTDSAELTIQKYQAITAQAATAPPTVSPPTTQYTPPAPPVTAPPTTPPRATCFDKIKNQGEEGIDCGSPCAPCKKFPISFPKAFPKLPVSSTLLVALLTILVSLIAIYIIYSKAVKRKKEYFIEEKPLATTLQTPQIQPVQLQPMIEPPKKPEPVVTAPSKELPVEPVKELVNYIKTNVKEFSKQEIESELLKVGWLKEQIDLAFKAVKTEQGIASLKMFVRVSLQKGFTKEQIKKALLAKKWPIQIIERALENGDARI